MVIIVGSVVTCSGRRRAIFCSEENCELCEWPFSLETGNSLLA